MFAPILAATIAAIGAAGFVLSSLLNATGASDPIFNAAALCLVAGPLLFLAYVVIGLCLDFARTELNPAAKSMALRPMRVAEAPLAQVVYIPEGLRRERKGPLNRSSGRGRQNLIG